MALQFSDVRAVFGPVVVAGEFREVDNWQLFVHIVETRVQIFVRAVGEIVAGDDFFETGALKSARLFCFRPVRHYFLALSQRRF